MRGRKLELQKEQKIQVEMFPGSFSRILTLSELQNTSADLVRT